MLEGLETTSIRKGTKREVQDTFLNAMILRTGFKKEGKPMKVIGTCVHLILTLVIGILALAAWILKAAFSIVDGSM